MGRKEKKKKNGNSGAASQDERRGAAAYRPEGEGRKSGPKLEEKDRGGMRESRDLEGRILLLPQPAGVGSSGRLGCGRGRHRGDLMESSEAESAGGSQR